MRKQSNMNATELRLGNLVYGNVNSDTVCTITGINKYDGITTTVHASCNIDGYSGISATQEEFHPIPLTEDWLEKFGLTKKYLENPFQDGGFELDEKGNKWYSWIKNAFNLEIQSNGEIWFEVYGHYNHIKYVHQLQNIYFALVKEELFLEPHAIQTK